MSKPSKSVEEILAAVDFQVDRLPHPIDLLSADLISDVSGVPKTTVLSAASSLDDVRLDVLTAAIARLGVVPGEATWNAMRASLTDASAGHGLAAILNARADELARDPAFPCFLSGFDRLSAAGVADAVTSACSLLTSELVPFADTVLHAAGENRSVVTHLGRMSMLSGLLAMALQRLIGGGGDFPSSEVNRRVAANVGFGLLADVRIPTLDGSAVDPYVPAPVARRVPEGNLRLAVDAAADLVLSGGVPLRFGMKLEDVLAASGVSSATFYRRFGSMVGFERKLIEQAGNEFVHGFRDDFFVGVLAAITDGSMSPADAIGELQRRASDQMDLHVKTKRPGTEVLPWMGLEIGTEVFAPAFLEVSQERGAFFLDFADRLGLPLAGGMDGTAVAATLHSWSWVAELLTRNAPDRDLTAAFMRERSAHVQRFVFGVS